MLFLVLGLVVLVIGWLSLLGAMTASRDARKTLQERLALVSLSPAVKADVPREPSMVASAIRRVGVRIRAAFAFGMRYDWAVRSSGAYLLAAGLGGAAAAWALFAAGLHFSWPLALPLIAGAFFLAPRTLLKREQSRAEQQFQNGFPDAIDMVIRMVRAGLPVSVAIRTVGIEGPRPVNEVFRGIGEQMEIGITLNDALRASAERIGLPDFRFFAVAVALQHSTGGNLTATLETLSEIMRKRRAMRLKGQATTGEVRVSAYILGALPFLVTGILLIVNPTYLAPLVTDPRGNFIVGMAMIGLLLGFLMMRRMMRKLLEV